MNTFQVVLLLVLTGCISAPKSPGKVMYMLQRFQPQLIYCLHLASSISSADQKQ